MSCPEVRLEEYFDGELADELRREVEAHLKDCVDCRTELDELGRLERLLSRAPEGGSPDADRFLQAVKRDSRRDWRIPLAAAAALLVAAGVFLSAIPRAEVDVLGELARYADQPATEIEDRIRAALPGALPALEGALDHADVRIQFAAASLLFKLAEPATRERVLARYQGSRATNGGWALLEPGAEEEDVELVPVAVSLALEGQERWALGVLRKLHRLNVKAQEKIVDSVVTLLHSDNPRVQKLALDIVNELDIDFPLSAVVDLLDSPELGDEALKILRSATGKDAGKDKEFWKKVLKEEP